MAANMNNMNTILTNSDVPGAKLVKDPRSCNMDVLKRWLECHVLKKTGKKEELVKRFEDALKINLAVDPKVDGRKWYDLKASTSNSGESNVRTESRDIPVHGWNNFHHKIYQPTLIMDICFFYLVESLDNNHTLVLLDKDLDSDEDDTQHDTVTAKPLRKGRNLLNCCFVEYIQDNLNCIENVLMFIIL